MTLPSAYSAYYGQCRSAGGQPTDAGCKFDSGTIDWATWHYLETTPETKLGEVQGGGILDAVGSLIGGPFKPGATSSFLRSAALLVGAVVAGYVVYKIWISK